MNEILVTIREVYGRRLIYPANDAAQHIVAIKGSARPGAKTLDWADLEHLKALGFTVREQHLNQLEEQK